MNYCPRVTLYWTHQKLRKLLTAVLKHSIFLHTCYAIAVLILTFTTVESTVMRCAPGALTPAELINKSESSGRQPMFLASESEFIVYELQQ